MSFVQTYFYKFWHALDVFLGSLLFRDCDITISAEVGLEMRKEKPALWARALNRFLNLLQPGHCELAIQADIARARAAIEYLSPPASRS